MMIDERLVIFNVSRHMYEYSIKKVYQNKAPNMHFRACQKPYIDVQKRAVNMHLHPFICYQNMTMQSTIMSLMLLWLLLLMMYSDYCPNIC